MLPILFSIGPIKIYSYGFFISLAFLVGSFVVWKRAKEEAYDEEKIFDALVLTILFALLGARVYFILLNFQNFGFNFLKWIWLTRYAGLCFHGGLIGGGIGLWWLVSSGRMGPACRQAGFWQTADIAVFGLALGQVIAKIGCFFNQKDFTQIYESLLALLTFYFLLKIERRYRMFSWYKSQAPGFLLLSYLTFYSLGRLFLEKLRGDSIYLSGLIVLASLVGLYLRAERRWQEDKKLLVARCLLLVNKIKYGMRIIGRKTRKKIKRRIKVGKDFR